MSLKFIHSFSTLLVCSSFVSACVTQPKIDVAKIGQVRTVVIEEFPAMNNVAVIGHFLPWLPGTHFTKRSDYFFVLDSNSHASEKIVHLEGVGSSGNVVSQNAILNAPKTIPIGQAAAAGIAGGIVTSAIQANAEETQKRAINFTREIKDVFPNFDLKREFLQKLVTSIEASGIKVVVNEGGGKRTPRLRWAGNDGSGISYETWENDSTSFDADLYMQISPLAFFSAHGPLNSYHGNITIGVALFEGRSKKFIGSQILRFENWDSKYSYLEYNALVRNIDKAVPALQEGLFALIPSVVDILNSRPVP